MRTTLCIGRKNVVGVRALTSGSFLAKPILNRLQVETAQDDPESGVKTQAPHIFSRGIAAMDNDQRIDSDAIHRSRLSVSVGLDCL